MYQATWKILNKSGHYEARMQYLTHLLTNERKQIKKVHFCESLARYIGWCFRKGSVLDLILFSIFVNGLIKFSNETEVIS